MEELIPNGELLQLTVEAATTAVRLDRYIADQVPDLSRSYARQLIDAGHIRLNEQPAKPSVLVRTGDQISIWLPAPEPTELIAQDLPLDIIYEDADVVVVNKVAGMVVHPAPGHPHGTLVNALLGRYPDLAVGGDLRPGIVHRIDKDTSGLLVVARHDRALHMLQDQQQAHGMQKIYWAVAEGRFREPSGVIDAPIGRHPSDRMQMAVVADGRPARSHWRVLEELGAYTLLEVQLETGRTHQIRVHFAHRIRPILGDPLYGPKRAKNQFGLERQFLHAKQLGFQLPSNGTWVTFEAPLPADLQEVLRRIRAKAGL